MRLDVKKSTKNDLNSASTSEIVLIDISKSLIEKTADLNHIDFVVCNFYKAILWTVRIADIFI